MHEVASGQEHFYLERELYTPAGLASAAGYVTEAYAYGAYGAAQIVRVTPFWPKLAESFSGNPYFFTGQRRDVVADTGRSDVKELYDYRHRTYDPQHGRFLQRDPLARLATIRRPQHLAIGDNSSVPSRIDYAEGGNLYEYLHGRPAFAGDSQGLWGPDVHYRRTFGWARLPTVHMKADPAEIVASADNGIDPPGNWEWVWSAFNLQLISWHFNYPPSTALRWGPTDSRYRHARDCRRLAVRICNDKGAWPGHSAFAANLIGQGLHPVQDWVAHGTWNPTVLTNNWYKHPGHTDDWGTDWVPPAWTSIPITDGILRHVPPSLLGIWVADWFYAGYARSSLTRRRTLNYITTFRDQLIPGSECYCELFDWD